MPTSRRRFLAASAATALSSLTAQAATTAGSLNDHEICVFTKPFNSLTFRQLAKKTADIGFDGIEAPVRPHGNIEPKNVQEQLPKLVEALEEHSLKVTVLTSDINDPANPVSEQVLRTAAKLGIQHYRMKYFRYDESRPVIGQISNWRAQLKDLAQMNKDLGITAVYQNHAGRNYFGAAIWDLHRALENIEPEHIGVAYDIRHATAEAGMSWPVGFQLIRPHIRVVYVKDFVWGEKKPTNVPLGEGRVRPEFFTMLAQSGFSGPVSLHEEYLDHRKPELVPEHWSAIANDLKTLKSLLK